MKVIRQRSSEANRGTKKLRVAHLVSHPIQYFAPLYRSLAKRPELDLTVYFCSGSSLNAYFDSQFSTTVRWDVPLLGGYRHVLFPHDMNRPTERFTLNPNWAILRDLLRKQYDVIWLHGYANVNSWLVVLVAKLVDTPVLLREEQTLLTPRSRVKRAIKWLTLPHIYKNVCGLYIGANSRRFFEYYGTPSKRLHRARYCVDNDLLQACRSKLRPQRFIIRSEFGIRDSEPVILFSGKLTDKKQPQLLLEAFWRVRQNIKCHLLFAGDGPLRQQLQTFVKANSVSDVHWAGFLNQTQLPAAYIAADFLVLPSAYQETWGLVINEAMNFGLPIIVSDQVGCAPDLVEHGRNGYIFQSGNVSDLAAALRTLVESPELRDAFGRRSEEIITTYSIEACAEEITTACIAVWEQSKATSFCYSSLKS